MSARIISFVLGGSLMLVPAAYSQLAPGTSDVAAQTPSEIARSLADQSALLTIRAKGKIKHSLKKGAPIFAMPAGPSSVVLLQLPEMTASYVMTITSSMKIPWSGSKRQLFVPSVIVLDDAFQQTGAIDESRLQGGNEKLTGVYAFDRKDRYLVLYTLGELVGQRLGVRGTVYGVDVPGLSKWLGRGTPVFRSLEGDLTVETKPGN
jgi:hypothetical protein